MTTQVNRTDLLALDYAFQGQPFADIDLTSSSGTLDLAFQGQPFVESAASSGAGAPARPVVFVCT